VRPTATSSLSATSTLKQRGCDGQTKTKLMHHAKTSKIIYN
jgi:hypothetical protein